MSKLGVQFQRPPQLWAVGKRNGRPMINGKYVKIMDPGLVDLFPHLRTIGRPYMPDGQSNALIWKGAAGADEWCNIVKPMIMSREYVYVWELPNEPVPFSSWEFCLAFVAFTRRAADILHSWSKRCIGGNISEGNPGGDAKERANLSRKIAEGLMACDFWGYHSYWVPDGYQHKEAGYNQWHANRHELIRQYAEEVGIILPKVILTETGWDFLIVGLKQKSWRSYAPWPVYFRSLKEHDAHLMADPYVEHASIFLAGESWGWDDFTLMEQECADLHDYIEATPDIIGVTPEPPPVKPEEPETMIMIGAIGRPLPSNRGTVSQRFGVNVATYAKYGFEGGHEGLDYSCPVGTSVLACSSGTVKFSGISTGANAAYGLYVVLDHGEFESWYCHLSSAAVKVGMTIKQGDVLGKSGNSGRSTGAHLHWAIRVPKAKNGTKSFVDPWSLRVILGDA